MKIAAAFVAMASLAFAACHTPEPQSPSAGLTRPVDPPKPPDLGHDASRVEVHPLYGIYFETIRDVCGGPDPFFSFDSTKADETDQATMQNLVACMTTGALRGKSITLTGRADPRGSEGYNEHLGLERAERVKRFLAAKGIDAARIKTESRGKDDARPLPKDWPSDRRVDVELTPAP
jgi:outer membrane protein OmpA-like peptidoglycan-associated protein